MGLSAFRDALKAGVGSSGAPPRPVAAIIDDVLFKAANKPLWWVRAPRMFSGHLLTEFTAWSGPDPETARPVLVGMYFAVTSDVVVRVFGAKSRSWSQLKLKPVVTVFTSGGRGGGGAGPGPEPQTLSQFLDLCMGRGVDESDSESSEDVEVVGKVRGCIRVEDVLTSDEVLQLLGVLHVDRVL